MQFADDWVKGANHLPSPPRNSFTQPTSPNDESRLRDCRAPLENLRAVRDRQGLGSAAVFALFMCDDAKPTALGARNQRRPIEQCHHQEEPSRPEQQAAERPTNTPGAGKRVTARQQETSQPADHGRQQHQGSKTANQAKMRMRVAENPGNK